MRCYLPSACAGRWVNTNKGVERKWTSYMYGKNEFNMNRIAHVKFFLIEVSPAGVMRGSVQVAV
jgi:hypothetical protein